ncbi:hypothetical protein C8Q72DRAFT_810169 [Fomitopsis betulina]|nr:hypothetical protein C8Q72DRAFT_810169 [Fomitopsis betulina]
MHPFLSPVINLNIVTLAHRDHQDKSMCIVLVVGDYEGGELCLYEPGLVLPLSNGDFAAFSSSCVTHYNLHFTGQRTSIVLHTDKEINKWMNSGHNSWETNQHFH